MRRLPLLPASSFGSVLGLAGLAASWRAAHAVWQFPAIVGELLVLAAALVWATLLVLYAAKWWFRREAAVAELHHPVQCCFVGLIGVATMLVGLGALPYSQPVAAALATAGALFALAFAVWRTGLLWQGGREPDTTTPVLYLPAVAGLFVASITAASFGQRDLAQLAFGAGLFAWLAIESVVVHRLYTGSRLPPPLRPTLGIQLAPPTVGALAYLGASGGSPEWVALALLGYGLMQALLLLRLLPWIRQQPFAPSYWAFAFGATALATVPIRMIEHGSAGVLLVLAPVLFAAANLVVGTVAVATLRLLIAGSTTQRAMPSIEART